MASYVQHRRILAGMFSMLTAATLTISVLAQDPEPFRRAGEITGRDTVYRKNVFMHWFTYRPRLEQRQKWNRTREGFFGTAGSINSNRLYFHEELHKRFDLNSALFASIRHKVDEDFDGEYTRTLTGIGTTFGDGWSAEVLGDIAPRKENIDASVELKWRGDCDSRFRIAVVATDALHNQKTVVEEYTQDPFTFFSEYWFYAERGAECGAWVNWNTPLELHVGENELWFTYEQIAFGARALLPLSRTAHFLAEVGTENGAREWREAIDSAPGMRDLDRSHAHLNLETEWELTPMTRMWIGYRYFALTELYTDNVTPEGNGEISRNENMLHAGVKWRVRRNLLFRPGAYVNQIDLQDLFPGDTDRSWEAEGLVGKLTLPLEIGFDNGATITLNMSFRTDILRSGGYNVQFFIPL